MSDRTAFISGSLEPEAASGKKIAVKKIEIRAINTHQET
jgi:hypothetical protein